MIIFSLFKPYKYVTSLPSSLFRPLKTNYQFQAALSIGFFLGVVFVMSNQMLILFAIFTDRATKVGFAEGASQLQAQHAMAVFSFFLFLVYGFFGAVLAIFRNDVVKDGECSSISRM
jgi:hypothetical protein